MWKHVVTIAMFGLMFVHGLVTKNWSAAVAWGALLAGAVYVLAHRATIGGEYRHRAPPGSPPARYNEETEVIDVNPSKFGEPDG